jgi:hypothetical protein
MCDFELLKFTNVEWYVHELSILIEKCKYEEVSYNFITNCWYYLHNFIAD